MSDLQGNNNREEPEVADKLMTTVEWFGSEWNDAPGAVCGWLNGIIADVYPGTDWDTDKPTGLWDWDVKVTSDRCEWPELVNNGEAATAAEAQAAAEVVMHKADADYPHISYT